MAADDHLVIIAASAAGMKRNQVLLGRQIDVVHKLNSAGIGMKDFACILKSEAILSAPFLRNGLNRKPCTIFEIGGCPIHPPQENEIFYIGLLTRSCQVQVLSRICACDGATP